MKNGAIESGFSKERIRVILDEGEAIEAAIASARPGDLVVIHPDDISNAIVLLLKHKEEQVSLSLDGEEPPVGQGTPNARKESDLGGS